MDPEFSEYLAPTEIIDSDNQNIIDYAMDAIKDAGNDPISKAVRLYYAVRDPIMEYLDFHGTYADVPVDEIVASWEKTYGKDRTDQWIADFEKKGGSSERDFDIEDVV